MTQEFEDAETSPSLVSVIVTAYNDEGVVARALSSLVLQTWPNIEIVLVDDGSTDATNEIAHDFDPGDRAFKVITKENGGLGSTRHAGAIHASGEYLCFLDADDEYAASKVEKQVKALKDLGRGILFSGALIIEEDGARRSRHATGGLNEITQAHVRGATVPAANASLMMHKADYEAMGGFEPLMRRQCEEDFLLRAFASGYRTYMLCEPLYIVHEAKGSNRWVYAGRIEYIERLMMTAGSTLDAAEPEARDTAWLFLNMVVKKLSLGAIRWPWAVRRKLARVFWQSHLSWMLPTNIHVGLIYLMPLTVSDRVFLLIKRLKRWLLD